MKKILFILLTLAISSCEEYITEHSKYDITLQEIEYSDSIFSSDTSLNYYIKDHKIYVKNEIGPVYELKMSNILFNRFMLIVLGVILGILIHKGFFTSVDHSE